MKAIKIIEVIGIIGIMALIYWGNAQVNIITEVETKTEETEYVDTTTEEFRNNYIDLRTITNYTEGNKGLQLNMKDGNSYSLDTEKVQNGITEVYNN